MCDGQRHDGVRVREREPRAAGGQAIEVRRLRRAAVRRQRVGAQRVDRDEQDVLVGVRFEHERAASEATRWRPQQARRQLRPQ